MKLDATIGISGFVALTVVAIEMGAPIRIFFDPAAFIISVVGTFLLLMATHGWAVSWSAISTGLTGLLSNSEHQGVENHEHGAQVAQSGSALSLLAGTTGAIIGVGSMLNNIDDPTAIGPAMAVSLLSVFYTMFMNMCIFVPVGRYHREMSRTTAR